jgi:hypothetical protein
MKLTVYLCLHTDRVYFIRADGNKMMAKSPGVIVPMAGQQVSSSLSW